jgi:hypothetical protein
MSPTSLRRVGLVLVAAGGGWTLGLPLASASGAWAEAPNTPAGVKQLPLNTDGHGVSVRRKGKEVVITFAKQAAASYNKIAGHRVDAGCETLDQTGGSGYAIATSGTGEVLVAPRRRRPFSAFVGPGGFDFCTVKLHQSKGQGATVEIAAVPVSRRGAIYLNERQTARDVLSVLVLVSLPSDTAPPAATQIQRRTHGQVAPLPGPNTRPPANLVGYWTDGRAEVYVAELTYDGTLFFFDGKLDTGVDTTNLFGWMSGQE